MLGLASFDASLRQGACSMIVLLFWRMAAVSHIKRWDGIPALSAGKACHAAGRLIRRHVPGDMDRMLYPMLSSSVARS